MYFHLFDTINLLFVADFKQPHASASEKSENLQLLGLQSGNLGEFPGTGDCSQELGKQFGIQRNSPRAPGSTLLFGSCSN